LRASKALAIIVLLVALMMAVGHIPLALGISFLFRPAGRQPPPPPSSSGQAAAGGAFSFFFALGAYFLFATIVYVLGGVLVASGKLFKLANLGLIIMAVVDNVLLLYTRTMPNIFFRRATPWSWGWFPLGTVQIFIGQVIIVVLCVTLLYKPVLQKAEQP
jgi:hypothetical protein